MTRPQVVVQVLLSMSLVGAAAACSAGGPAATPRPTCGWTYQVLDTLSKPSSTSTSDVLLAALIQVDGYSCGPLVHEGSPKWVGSSAYVFDKFAGVGGPTEPRDLCPVIYDAPSTKHLDELHPDAVKPALPSPDTWASNSGPKKGWVSWEVETRPDCDMQFSWELAPIGTDIKPGQPLDMGAWDIAGPDSSTEVVPSSVEFELRGGSSSPERELSRYGRPGKSNWRNPCHRPTSGPALRSDAADLAVSFTSFLLS